MKNKQKWIVTRLGKHKWIVELLTFSLYRGIDNTYRHLRLSEWYRKNHYPKVPKNNTKRIVFSTRKKARVVSKALNSVLEDDEE